MIIRIVKLSFEPTKVPLFLDNFKLIKNHIRNAPGNRLLELYQDKNDSNIFLLTVIGKQKSI